MEGLTLDWYADAYYAAARAHHWPAPVVNEMEAWELWAALGHALSPYEWEQVTNPPAPSTRRGRRRRGGPEQVPSAGRRDLIAERVAWLKGQGPKPEASPDAGEAGLARVLGTAPGAGQQRGTS